MLNFEKQTLPIGVDPAPVGTPPVPAGVVRPVAKDASVVGGTVVGGTVVGITVYYGIIIK